MKRNCNGTPNTPCDAALDTLPRDSRVLARWRGVVACPKCGRAWRGDYYALARWPGDKGAAFAWREETRS